MWRIYINFNGTQSISLMWYSNFYMVIKVLKSYKYAMIYSKWYCKYYK